MFSYSEAGGKDVEKRWKEVAFMRSGQMHYKGRKYKRLWNMNMGSRASVLVTTNPLLICWSCFRYFCLNYMLWTCTFFELIALTMCGYNNYLCFFVFMEFPRSIWDGQVGRHARVKKQLHILWAMVSPCNLVCFPQTITLFYRNLEVSPNTSNLHQIRHNHHRTIKWDSYFWTMPSQLPKVGSALCSLYFPSQVPWFHFQGGGNEVWPEGYCHRVQFSNLHMYPKSCRANVL